MNVRVEVLFDPPNEDAWGTMRSLGREVTNDRRSVRVFALEDDPDWLVAEFTMATEAHYKALEKVERAVRLCAWERMDSSISFPKTEAERARARRKTERRRVQRGGPLPKRIFGDLRLRDAEKAVGKLK